MIEESDTFGGSWPFQARYFEGRGFRHHFIDEGKRGGPETFVCLHGEPTWGYIYRSFVTRLGEIGRVIVPDHMGFGKSETPQDRAYSVEEHCDNLEALLLSLDAEGITFVMQDWGGPIGTNFALRHPDRIRRMVYIDSLTRVGIPKDVDPAVLMTVGTTPWAEFFTSEDFDPVMSHLSRNILSVLKLIGFENNDVITDEWIRAYAAPFPTPADCVGAKAFPLNTINPVSWAYTEAPMREPTSVEALREKPALMMLGAEDRTAPAVIAEALLHEIWPEAPSIHLPGVGHFAQEDAPETVIALIEQFVATSLKGA